MSQRNANGAEEVFGSDGLVGIPIEVLSYFGVYRLMADRSSKHAHAYRAGIFGMLIFGVLVHVM